MRSNTAIETMRTWLLLRSDDPSLSLSNLPINCLAAAAAWHLDSQHGSLTHRVASDGWWRRHAACGSSTRSCGGTTRAWLWWLAYTTAAGITINNKKTDSSYLLIYLLHNATVAWRKAARSAAHDAVSGPHREEASDKGCRVAGSRYGDDTEWQWTLNGDHVGPGRRRNAWRRCLDDVPSRAARFRGRGSTLSTSGVLEAKTRTSRTRGQTRPRGRARENGKCRGDPSVRVCVRWLGKSTRSWRRGTTRPARASWGLSRRCSGRSRASLRVCVDF
jgi:hypothetical protein